MSLSLDVLRLRVLLCFYNNNSKDCSVTNVSRILNEEKYKVSRVIIELEKEGLMDRSNQRKPILTMEGELEAKRYAERIDVTISHLMYEGVDSSNAKNDALHWALYNSESTMEVIKATEQNYRLKVEMRDCSCFNGAKLCKRMQDGIYKFPFLIYRENVKDGNNISMANKGFEQLCVLEIRNGVGTVQLSAKEMTIVSPSDGKKKRGKVCNLQYMDNGTFVKAETSGNIISFPASVLEFINVGQGVGQILHGSVCLKMECTVGSFHMPKSKAIFTIMI